MEEALTALLIPHLPGWAAGSHSHSLHWCRIGKNILPLFMFKNVLFKSVENVSIKTNQIFDQRAKSFTLLSSICLALYDSRMIVLRLLHPVSHRGCVMHNDSFSWHPFLSSLCQGNRRRVGNTKGDRHTDTTSNAVLRQQSVMRSWTTLSVRPFQ